MLRWGHWLLKRENNNILNMVLKLCNNKRLNHLDEFGGGAKFDYLMVNEFINNYFCKNYQTVFKLLSGFRG